MSLKKFVIVLNKGYPLERMVSAIGHVSIGLSSSLGTDDLSLVTYQDASGDSYPSISDWPVMILRGGGGQIRTAKDRLRVAGLPAIAYTDTMFEGGSDHQQALTAARSTDQVEIVALATFGEAHRLDPITKKFSLWR